jgi:hypothetical protein
MPKDCQLLSYFPVEERRGMRTKIPICTSSVYAFLEHFCSGQLQARTIVELALTQRRRRVVRHGLASGSLRHYFFSGITAYVFFRQ